MIEGATVRWRSFLDEAADRLQRAGCASPDVDARRIVEQASGREGPELHAALDEPATERGAAHFDTMLERRLAGEPLQYVLGRWAFRHLDLMVDRRVLIPRPETEVVAGVALDELARAQRDDRTPRAVDLGTGSGAIGLSLATENPEVEVWLTDRSADALAVARANLAGLGRDATRVMVVEGSWFDALPDMLVGSLDVVVSNPPYIADDEGLPADVDDWEPGGALRSGPAGTEQLVAIVAGAGRWLRPGGALVLELAPHQADTMTTTAQQEGYTDVVIVDDLAGRPRVLRARSWP